MAPTFRHGRDARFSITTTTGGTIQLSSGLNELTLSRSMDTAEVTTFGLNDKQYVVGLRDASFKAAGNFASTYDKKLQPLLGWSSGTNFVYGPESTASGRRKYTGKAHITSLEISSPAADMVGISMEFQVTGAITSTNF